MNNPEPTKAAKEFPDPGPTEIPPVKEPMPAPPPTEIPFTPESPSPQPPNEVPTPPEPPEPTPPSGQVANSGTPRQGLSLL